MSNTPVARRRRHITITLLLASAVAACSDAAPTAAPTPYFDGGLQASKTSAAGAERDRLERALDREEARIKATKEKSRDAYDADKDAWKAEEKLAKEKGGLSLLRCKPLPYEGEAKIIGPEGGDIQMGPHRLRIPRNALKRAVLITGEASAGSFVAVQFAPHGLVFDGRPELTLSYSHCERAPASRKHSVVYVDELGTPAEFPPSADSRGLDEVKAKIAHFSAYMVAYRGMTEPE